MKKSLDPRVNRLSPQDTDDSMAKSQLDQLESYEIFLQLKEGRPYTHVGIVHAATEEFAFIFAKEQFSRRLTCNGIWVARTQNVFSTTLSEEGTACDNVPEINDPDGPLSDYEIFHLLKRGKQQMHAGTIQGSGYQDALMHAKTSITASQPIISIWVIKSDDLFRSADNDRDMWATLPEKIYRDAIDYKGQSKIDEFKNSSQA